ncbi:TPA: hypothetical protein ACJKHU_002171, partial [Neisseria meningitidis]
PAVNLPRRSICRLHKTPEYCPNHGEWPKNFVIPAQAGIQVCRHGNLSGKKVSPVLSSRFPLSWE